MKELFHKIQVELTKKPSPREKRKSLLHAIGGGCYVDKLVHNIPPPKKRELIKKWKEEEDKIKRIITEANQEWCDGKFQIHWNKLEWANPRSRYKRKNPFCVSSKKYVSKITINLHIGLVTRKYISLDIDEFF